ncbi:Methylenetetrahydrofolate reductase [Trachymyrmex zeteki]|uniref:Methylenetetrahydrofolate reductase n=1 Tax=Mycetomoellerius zeteki TaxID=64791 RepID=A0A151X708_9HYME|nr:PREDICTED: methylenetetrahydrofolate reductase [Trachymyrmex zeteki]KYQ56114.1 Methylenetetrahydrofolate reductase [Trachymyrmex zeteki]
MRNLILENDMCERNDADGNDNPSTPDFHTEDPRKTVVDLRRLLKDKISKNEIFCSFEIVSTRKSGAFYRRLLIDMEEYSPLFYALTWHNEAASDNDGYLPLDLAENFPPNTLLHLAAKDLKRDEVVYILKKALAFGIINIFALRGDSLSENGDFEHAVDLVAFIRQRFGDTFCVCVAGYPQMHPESSSKELDLHYLKAKVEAGADFIITQICFDSRVLINFVRDCREIGIQIPILPGILAPTNHACLEKMIDICRLDVPIKIKEDLARMKDDDQAARKYSVVLIAQIITDVIRNGATCGFHLFTLNRLSLVAEICKRIESFKAKNL